MTTTNYHCLACGSPVVILGCWDTQADHEARCTGATCPNREPTLFDCQDWPGLGSLAWVASLDATE